MMQLLSQQYNQFIIYLIKEVHSITVVSTIIPPLIDFPRYPEDETSVFIRKLNKISRLEYYFDNPKEIERFLLTHDYLIEYLFEAFDQIKKIFKENLIEIRLEYDRDSEEDFEGLFVNIKTNLSPEPSLDLLEKFDEEWWLKVDFKIRSVITIMVNPI